MLKMNLRRAMKRDVIANSSANSTNSMENPIHELRSSGQKYEAASPVIENDDLSLLSIRDLLKSPVRKPCRSVEEATVTASRPSKREIPGMENFIEYLVTRGGVDPLPARLQIFESMKFDEGPLEPPVTTPVLKKQRRKGHRGILVNRGSTTANKRRGSISLSSMSDSPSGKRLSSTTQSARKILRRSVEHMRSIGSTVSSKPSKPLHEAARKSSPKCSPWRYISPTKLKPGMQKGPARRTSPRKLTTASPEDVDRSAVSLVSSPVVESEPRAQRRHIRSQSLATSPKTAARKLSFDVSGDETVTLSKRGKEAAANLQHSKESDESGSPSLTPRRLSVRARSTISPQPQERLYEAAAKKRSPKCFSSEHITPPKLNRDKQSESLPRRTSPRILTATKLEASDTSPPTGEREARKKRCCSRRLQCPAVSPRNEAQKLRIDVSGDEAENLSKFTKGSGSLGSVGNAELGSPCESPRRLSVRSKGDGDEADGTSTDQSCGETIDLPTVVIDSTASTATASLSLPRLRRQRRPKVANQTPLSSRRAIHCQIKQHGVRSGTSVRLLLRHRDVRE